jgi:hypothetical protein
MSYTPDDLERLHRQALERAQALRGEAMDEAWHDLDRWLHRSAGAALRAGERLAHRLQQHRRQRGMAPDTPQPTAHRPGLLGRLAKE